jgi:PKD repeat protein
MNAKYLLIGMLLMVLFLTVPSSANQGNTSAILCLTGNSTNPYTDICGGHTITAVDNVSSSPIGAFYGDGSLNLTNLGRLSIPKTDFSYMYGNYTPWTLKFTLLGHAPADTESILYNGAGTGTSVGIWIYYSTGRTIITIIGNGSSTKTMTSSPLASAANANNITITFDPTRSTNLYRIRNNGELIGTMENIVTTNATSGSLVVYIGGTSITSGKRLNNYIDDITFLRGVALNASIPMDTEYITNPSSSFTANRTSGYAPLSVKLTNTNIGNVNTTSYRWFTTNATGDNTQVISSIIASPEFILPVGNYSIILEASNEFGISNSSATWVNVSPPPPVSSFNANVTNGPSPLAVALVDTSTGNPTSWSWNITNGGIGVDSTNQNIVITYNTPGVYSINHTVSNIYGTSILVSQNLINVYSPSGPLASFTATPLSGYPPLVVQFTDLSTSPNPILTWNWSFGDGIYSNDQNPSYTYSSSGSYTVNLSVTSISGGSTSSVPNAIKVLAAQSSIIPVENNVNMAFTICGVALVLLSLLVIILGAYLSSKPMTTKKEQETYGKLIMAAIVVVIIGFIIIGIGIGTLGPMLTAMGG